MRAEEKKEIKRTHTVGMTDRGMLALTGVSDVDSFNEQMVVLTTSAGGACCFWGRSCMFRRSIWRLGSLIWMGGSTCWNTPITGRAVNADSGACT